MLQRVQLSVRRWARDVNATNRGKLGVLRPTLRLLTVFLENSWKGGAWINMRGAQTHNRLGFSASVCEGAGCSPAERERSIGVRLSSLVDTFASGDPGPGVGGDCVMSPLLDWAGRPIAGCSVFLLAADFLEAV